MLAIVLVLLALAVRVNANPARPIAPVDPETAAEDADELDTDEDLEVEPTPGATPLATDAAVPSAAPRPARRLPPVSAVVAAAYRASSLDASPAPGWRWRTRLAGLVPIVTVREGRDATWRDIADPTIGYVSVFTVSATWKLDRLLFDPNELRISAIEAARRRERRRVASEAIQAYFALARTGSSDRAAEATAVLDALTDGWFSDELTPRGGPKNLPLPGFAGQARR